MISAGFRTVLVCLGDDRGLVLSPLWPLSVRTHLFSQTKGNYPQFIELTHLTAGYQKEAQQQKKGGATNLLRK